MDQTGPNYPPSDKVEEPIEGAEAIAAYLFGDRSKRRRVYYLVEKTALPVYRMGSTLCLRPSVFTQWVEQQESRASTDAKRKA